MRRIPAALLVIFGTIAGARAEDQIVLKPGPGRDKVETHCVACHSLDYIVMNSRFLTEAQWKAEVTKMIEAFKAPIDPADAAQITDYLATNYGG
jgi:mono/diheme cytochrome c family protein